MTGSLTKAGLIGGAATLNPAALVVAPLASPRLVGEGIYAAGRASKALEPAGDAALKASRAAQKNAPILYSNLTEDERKKKEIEERLSRSLKEKDKLLK
jgi:hypothetical protein